MQDTISKCPGILNPENLLSFPPNAHKHTDTHTSRKAVTIDPKLKCPQDEFECPQGIFFPQVYHHKDSAPTYSMPLGLEKLSLTP